MIGGGSIRKWVLKHAASDLGFRVDTHNLSPRTLRTLNDLMRSKMVIYCGSAMRLGETRTTKKEVDVFRITEQGDKLWRSLNAN